jgi:hypothetical protein
MIYQIIKNILDVKHINVYLFNKNNLEYEISKIKPKKYSGVYWLLNNEEIVYIGQSNNLLSRIRSHIYTNKIWNRAKCVEIENTKLTRWVEISLLKNIDTKYNNNKFVDRITAKSRFITFREHLNFYCKVYVDKKSGRKKYKKYMYNCLNRVDIILYLKLWEMDFCEFEENFNKMLRGEKFDINKI